MNLTSLLFRLLFSPRWRSSGRVILMTVATAMTATSMAHGTDKLILDAYLSQVREQHQGYRASHRSVEGAKKRAQEGSLLFSPNLISTAQLVNDQRQTLSAAFQGNQTKIDTFSLGVSQQTRFGLKGSLLYDIDHTRVFGASPDLVSNSEFYDNSLSLEVAQPLWKNGFGRQLRARETALKASALASAYSSRFEGRATLSEAEIRYWRLATARATLEIQEEAIKRANSLLSSVGERVRVRLSDQSDLLQTRALLGARTLDSRTAQTEVKLAARAFNSARGVDSDQVAEILELPDAVALHEVAVPSTTPPRDDIRAAEKQKDASMANARSAQEEVKPDVTAFASIGLNGRDSRFGEAGAEAFTTQYPLTTVGVRMTVPLDLGTVKRIQSGYEIESEAAQLRYNRAQFDQDVQWNDLIVSLNETRERLSLAAALEEAQSKKLNEEKARLKRGRSTTFQIATFEQEYLASQIIRIQTQGQILSLLAQLKTFGGEPIGDSQ